MADNISVNVTEKTLTTQPGSAGLNTQVPGQAATVSGAAEATGGIGAGHFVERDIDQNLFNFRCATHLYDLSIKAKNVSVTSPEVEHYMIDDQRAFVTVKTELAESTAFQTTIPLEAKDANFARPYSTLLVSGVAGYAPDGKTQTPGQPLMLLVTGISDETGNPIVRAMNGKKANPSDEFGKIPTIPAGTKIYLLSNALYETQKEVEPDLYLPTPSVVYLQKRAFNTIISDYFESQKKRTPFSKAQVAEQAIVNFKRKGNRTYWAGRAGKIKVDTKKVGMQYLYTTEGIRWQFKRELRHVGKWVIEELIALAKMFYTGNDKPSSCTALLGKNLLESLQCVDYSKHPEVKIETKENKIGWSVVSVKTVFGDIDLLYEPALDELNWANSGALMSLDHLVRYVRSSEKSFNDDIEGEEAKRSGAIVWDAVALKGNCHIWIDGEGTTAPMDGIQNIGIWKESTAPTGKDLVVGRIYYLQQAVASISANSAEGQMWQWDGTNWKEVKGDFQG